MSNKHYPHEVVDRSVAKRPSEDVMGENVENKKSKSEKLIEKSTEKSTEKLIEKSTQKN